MNIARSFSGSSSRSGRLLCALRATRQRNERGEFVAPLAYTFVRTGQRIMASQRRKPITGEFDFVDRRSNRTLIHRFGKDRINALSFVCEIAQSFSPSAIGASRAASRAGYCRLRTSIQLQAGCSEIKKQSSPPLASLKDLTSNSLRQYERLFLGILSRIVFLNIPI
jgi:hypothetical protein